MIWVPSFMFQKGTDQIYSGRKEKLGCTRGHLSRPPISIGSEGCMAAFVGYALLLQAVSITREVSPLAPTRCYGLP